MDRKYLGCSLLQEKPQITSDFMKSHRPSMRMKISRIAEKIGDVMALPIKLTKTKHTFLVARNKLCSHMFIHDQGHLNKTLKNGGASYFLSLTYKMENNCVKEASWKTNKIYDENIFIVCLRICVNENRKVNLLV